LSMLKLSALTTILAGVVFAQAPPLAGNLVTGAPYSADVVTEVVAPPGAPQTAAPSPVGHVYRDSAGRTRTEQPMLAGPVTKNGEPGEIRIIVQISDPVAGVRYRLDTAGKVAHKQLIPAFAKPADPRFAGLAAGVPTMLPPPPPGGLGAPSLAGAPSGPGGMQAAKLPQPEITVEKLGTKTIEGVAAEGTRRTTVLPAGMTGGNAPVATVSESWIAPDLQVTVLSKAKDMQSGEHITKLVNVKRSEPPAALFAPPADYKIVDDMALPPMPPAPGK